MTFIFTQFYLSSSHHRNNKESSFWYNIFNYITINKTYLIDLVKEYHLNDEFRNHTALYILFEHLVELFNDWLKMMMEDISIRMNKDVTENNMTKHTFADKCKEVNGFFVFAVSSMHKKYLDKLQDSNLLESDEKYTLICTTLDYLKHMRILHSEALINRTYIEKGYYTTTHQLLNTGGLTLISSEYFTFGLALMDKIRTQVCFDAIQKGQNNCYTSAKDEILKDENLLELFEEAGSTFINQLDEKKEKEKAFFTKSISKMYCDLCTKALNARYKESLKQYQEKYIGRYSEKGSDVSLRNQMKVTEKKVDVRKAKQLIQSQRNE